MPMRSVGYSLFVWRQLGNVMLDWTEIIPFERMSYVMLVNFIDNKLFDLIAYETVKIDWVGSVDSFDQLVFDIAFGAHNAMKAI